MVCRVWLYREFTRNINIKANESSHWDILLCCTSRDKIRPHSLIQYDSWVFTPPDKGQVFLGFLMLNIWGIWFHLLNVMLFTAAIKGIVKSDFSSLPFKPSGISPNTATKGSPWMSFWIKSLSWGHQISHFKIHSIEGLLKIYQMDLYSEFYSPSTMSWDMLGFFDCF